MSDPGGGEGGGVHHIAINRGDGTWTHISGTTDELRQIADRIEEILPELATAIRNSLPAQ